MNHDPVMGFEDSLITRENFLTFIKQLRFIFNNESLALDVRVVTTTYSLTNRSAIIIADTTAGAFTVTLQSANRWGTGKSPVLVFRNIGAGVLTVMRSSADTIDGAASVNVAAGGSLKLITDSVNRWFSVV